MSDTRPGALSAEPSGGRVASLARNNLLLSRALAAVQDGRLDDAARLVDAAPGDMMSLGQLYLLHKSELETQAQQLLDTQERLAHALDWHAGLFHRLPVSALLVDELGLVVDANACAQAELRLDQALRTVNLPLRRLAAGPEEEHRLVSALRQCMGSAAAPAVLALDDMALRTPDGQTRWADLRLTHLPPRAGTPDATPLALVVLNDRTARVQAQRARDVADHADRRRERAEVASEAKSRLLSRLSHELRTPLNAVLGFSHLLMTEPGTSAEALRRLGHIQNAGQHLLALVEDVLEINRAESGSSRLVVEQTPLLPLVNDVLALHEPLVLPLAVSLRAEGEAHTSAWTDPRRLWEVLTNLVNNAIKYNVRGGQVCVRVHAKPDSLPAPAAPGPALAPGAAVPPPATPLVRGATQVCIEVCDTGMGMRHEQLAQLFEPFNRLGAEHGPVAGHGLGLSIAKTQVQAMGGRMAVRSTPGEGSCFTLLLPASPAGLGLPG